MDKGGPTRGKWESFIALCALSLAGNWLSLPLFFGIDLIFGSIAVMLAAVYLGFWAAGLIALVGALYTLFLWGQPLAMPAFILEGLVVAWLYHRRKLTNLVLADLAFWLVIGSPVVVLVYSTYGGMADSAVMLIALKQAVNGVFNALLAGLVVLLISYRAKKICLSIAVLDHFSLHVVRHPPGWDYANHHGRAGPARRSGGLGI
ncbi:hypothetical protein [Halopseudomonas sp.]|jgi:uncharacterized membrane protein|uniref:hypothetical protein n=1 Tax=Halopseudomonas sp. TaxID=2901191 RepID=UPI0039E56FA7